MGAIPTYLLIVSRQHPDLYRYLRKRFVADERAQVVLDRRWKAAPRAAAGNGGDRRSRPQVDAALVSRSHVLITLA